MEVYEFGSLIIAHSQGIGGDDFTIDFFGTMFHTSMNRVVQSWRDSLSLWFM